MKISILSSVKNEQRFLAEMIESVLRQDYPDWELLIVDDGSTDSTAEIIRLYAEKDRRIRPIERVGRHGKVSGFNSAYAAASGDVLALLAGDDVLPDKSLATRMSALAPHAADRSVGFFKLRTMSENKRFDGQIIPRGARGNRSGGTFLMSRGLADVVFPIDSALVAEDIWLGEAARDLAAVTIERPDIVLHYRIHGGNSNPRLQPFERMTESIHLRHRAWLELTLNRRLNLSALARRRLTALWRAELFRHDGKWVRILWQTDLPLVTRASMISMGNRYFFSIRTRFYALLSGWR